MMFTRFATLQDYGNGVWVIHSTDGSVSASMEIDFVCRGISTQDGLSYFIKDHPDLRITAMLLENGNLIITTERKHPEMTAEHSDKRPAELALVMMLDDCYRRLDEIQKDGTIETSVGIVKIMARADAFCDVLATMEIPTEHMEEVMAKLIAVKNMYVSTQNIDALLQQLRRSGRREI